MGFRTMPSPQATSWESAFATVHLRCGGDEEWRQRALEWLYTKSERPPTPRQMSRAIDATRSAVAPVGPKVVAPAARMRPTRGRDALPALSTGSWDRFVFSLLAECERLLNYVDEAADAAKGRGPSLEYRKGALSERLDYACWWLTVAFIKEQLSGFAAVSAPSANVEARVRSVLVGAMRKRPSDRFAIHGRSGLTRGEAWVRSTVLRLLKVGGLSPAQANRALNSQHQRDLRARAKANKAAYSISVDDLVGAGLPAEWFRPRRKRVISRKSRK